MERMRLRLGLLVLIALLVGPGLAHAQPSSDQSQERAAAHQQPSLLAEVWHWAASVFLKAGSFIDPLGVNPPSGQQPSTNQIDAGSFIDPLGNG